MKRANILSFFIFQSQHWLTVEFVILKHIFTFDLVTVKAQIEPAFVKHLFLIHLKGCLILVRVVHSTEHYSTRYAVFI